MSSLENWIKSNYDRSELNDIVAYGCQSGFSGLTYYHETTEIYQKFSAEIWQLVSGMSDDFGYKSIFDFLKSLDRSQNVYDDATFKNLLVWLAVEAIANQLISEEEESDESD